LADLSQAYRIREWRARGEYVYQRLRETAQRSGDKLFLYLLAKRAAPRWLIVPNAIAATVDYAILNDIASRVEVAYVDLNHVRHIPEFTLQQIADPEKTVEWNIAQIGADQVWSTFGVTGTGVVIGSLDTGVMYDHPALVDQYRGNSGGGNFEHNYNWYDLINGVNLPYDDNGHGTMAMGIALGDDGGSNQIGVAPGAKWIAIKALTSEGFGSDADLHAAMEWMLAPTDLNGANPDPNKRPHVGLNLWGSAGCGNEFQFDLQVWRAAGILPVFSAGGGGPGCSTIGSPADLPEAVTAGSTDEFDSIASFSPRGPSCMGLAKPDISAPGVNIRTSYNNGGYVITSGTGWSASHLGGTAALTWSANPDLTLDQMLDNIYKTALSRWDGQCGNPQPPNDVYGWGRIDAFEAVSLTLGQSSLDELPWLNVEPRFGEIIPGNGVSINLGFNAGNYGAGNHLGYLDINSNDPISPHIAIPVTMTVKIPCLLVKAIPKDTPIVIPPGGGWYDFRTGIKNVCDDPRNFDLWMVISRGDGEVYISGTRDVALDVGGTFILELRRLVPESLPPGVYTHSILVGSFPEVIEASDDFNWKKDSP
jgi:hypothetical protein